MTGHQPLIAMRHDRRVPACVWLTDGPDPSAGDWHMYLNCFDCRMHATISIAATDIPEALDLRCVVGLPVHVSGIRGESRVRRLHDAAVVAKARLVVTVLPNSILFHNENNSNG